MTKRFLLIILLISTASQIGFAEEIDASDPTKIYLFAGPGFKHTAYASGDSLNEFRIILESAVEHRFSAVPQASGQGAACS